MSLAVRGDLVYVANQAVPFANPTSAPNITGFRLDKAGGLIPIAGSTIEFLPGEGPAQIEFNRAGTVLAVTAARHRVDHGTNVMAALLSFTMSFNTPIF